MTSTYKAGLTLCGAFLLVFCFVRLQDLEGKQKDECEETEWKPLESIADIGDYSDCGLLGRLYRVSVEGTEIRIPSQLGAKLRQWLQEDEDLIQQSVRQRVIQITNKISGETTHYNPLRARRPGSQAQQSREYVDKIVRESQASCDFCRAGNLTAEELWGRIDSPYCVTAANMFRLSGPNNGLILSRKHHILDLGEEELIGLMNCCRDWYSAVHQSDPSLVAPMMVWDTLAHSGASQIHPHIQTWLGRHYEGQFSVLERQARDYRAQHGADYYHDLVQLHSSLGLAIKHGQATALVPLTSHKDHEIMIISREVGPDFLFLFGRVMQMYNEKLAVYCRSLGMMWPRLVSSEPAMPAVLRVGSRGACDSQISDVSSLELYGVYSVNVEPLTTINTLKLLIRESTG